MQDIGDFLAAVSLAEIRNRELAQFIPNERGSEAVEIMQLRERDDVVIDASIAQHHLADSVVILGEVIRHPLNKPDRRGVEELAAIDAHVRLLIDNIVLKDMDELMENHLTKRRNRTRKRDNDAVFEELSEPTNAFVEFLQDDVRLLKIPMRLVKDERCPVLQLVFKIFAVLFVSFLGDGCHERHEFCFTRIIVDVKVLRAVNVPIEALPSNLVFPEALSPNRSRLH